MFMFAIAQTTLHCGSIRKYSERLLFINTVQTYIFSSVDFIFSGIFHRPLEGDHRPEGLNGHGLIELRKFAAF